jgi:predicted regulator of Ras-like GTPase activity (Roadblock/LC7/MglB family)
LTIEEAIRDLLDVSTDVTAVAVLDAEGAVVASGPGATGAAVAEAAAGLWAEASRRAQEAGAAALEHVVVPVDGAVVTVVQAQDLRAVAVTRPDPAVALLLFDLRTCLGDAAAVPEEAQ